jgi:hypothetical protein
MIREPKLNDNDNSVLCDGDCNNCVLILAPNARMLTRILNKIYEKHQDIYEIVEGLCPNLTCCYDCRVDDFTHFEGCNLG